MSDENALTQACELVREIGLGNVLAELAPKAKSPKELTEMEAVAKIQEAKEQGKTVAFASGCFDILHIGHILFFGDCKQEVDLLFVGIDSNDNVSGAKGSDHPMFDDMLGGLDLGGSIGVVGGGGVTGSEALRRHSSFRGNLANGELGMCRLSAHRDPPKPGSWLARQ